MWDKILMLFFYITGFTLYIIPGFDVMRYEWSESLPLWLEMTAMAIHLALGSRFGLIAAAILVMLIIVRTYFEDRTLHAELNKCSEYQSTY